MDWRSKTGRVVVGVELRITPTTAPSCPGTARRWARSRSAAPGSPVPTTRRTTREVPRRLAADRRCRLRHPRGLHPDHRPAKDVIKSGASGSPPWSWRAPSWATGGEGGGGRRRPRRAVGRAAAGLRGPEGRGGTSVEDLKAYLADRVAKWWLPERWRSSMRSQDQRGQVRQEGFAGPLRPTATSKSRRPDSRPGRTAWFFQYLGCQAP